MISCRDSAQNWRASQGGRPGISHGAVRIRSAPEEKITQVEQCREEKKKRHGPEMVKRHRAATGRHIDSLETKQRQPEPTRDRVGLWRWELSSLPLPPNATSISRPQCTTSLPRRGGREREGLRKNEARGVLGNLKVVLAGKGRHREGGHKDCTQEHDCSALSWRRRRAPIAGPGTGYID